MSNDDEWTQLVNSALNTDLLCEVGDIPSIMGIDVQELGTNNPSIYAGYSDISPKSPKSPAKKEGKGYSVSSDAGGVVDGQFFCDKYRGVGALVNLRLAPDKGLECGKCSNLGMFQFSRPSDRRLFHWRCSKGFEILEAGYAGERIHIAPPDCDQYTP